MLSLHSFTNILIQWLFYCDIEGINSVIFRLKANLHDSCKISNEIKLGIKSVYGREDFFWWFNYSRDFYISLNFFIETSWKEKKRRKNIKGKENGRRNEKKVVDISRCMAGRTFSVRFLIGSLSGKGLSTSTLEYKLSILRGSLRNYLLNAIHASPDIREIHDNKNPILIERSIIYC